MMKRILLLTLMCLLTLAGTAQNNKSNYVEVLYFYGKQRCATCMAIEKCTKEVVLTDMAGWVKQGKVRFKEVDISTAGGKKLAEKYRVSFSSLYVNQWKNGKEKRHDLTRMGFSHARKNPAHFKKQLKQQITQLLK